MFHIQVGTVPAAAKSKPGPREILVIVETMPELEGGKCDLKVNGKLVGEVPGEVVIPAPAAGSYTEFALVREKALGRSGWSVVVGARNLKPGDAVFLKPGDPP